jgi:hypothetical protein
MVNKKTTILVIIALVLAITAISMRVIDSEKISTSLSEAGNNNAGNIGVTINPPIIEDKLSNETPGENT